MKFVSLWIGLPQSLAKSVACPAHHQVVPDHRSTPRRSQRHAARRNRPRSASSGHCPVRASRTAFPHAVPLNDLAMAADPRSADVADFEFVFPAEEGGPLAASVVTRAISRAHETSEARPLGRFGIEAWSAHDLRRDGAPTNMARLGVVPVRHRARRQTIASLTPRAAWTFAPSTSASIATRPKKCAALDSGPNRLTAIVGDGAAATVLPIRKRQ